MMRALPAVVAIALAACAAEPPAPHILLVTFDTLRLDHVGTYARGGRHTPNLDALAAKALVYEAAFTAMPTTSPAHTSLFTGLHPHEHGVMRNGMQLAADVAAARSLPSKLREAGYTTAAFTTSRVFGPNLMGLVGFDTSGLPSEAVRPGVDAVDAALAWLDGAKGQPTFLWVHLFGAHSPYGTQAEKQDSYPVDLSSYGWVDRSRYADPQARVRMAEMYARGVRAADAAFGKLVAGARSRLEPDPLIIATADHGELLDELLDAQGFAYGHGAILDETVLRIPLLIAGPGVEARRNWGAVSIRDLYTTVLEMAGIGDPAAEREDRRDLRLPLARRRLVSAERRVFSTSDQARRGIGPEALVHIRMNAVAVTDGTDLVVLGEDGTARAFDGPASNELEASAREFLAARIARSTASGEGVVDGETRRALQSLGYLE